MALRRLEQRLLSIALTLTALTASSSCATGQVHLQSTPAGATVRIKAIGDGTWKEFGQTPLVLQSSNFKNPGGVGSGPILVEFSKDGYATTKSVITEATAANILLEVDLEPRSNLEKPGAMNALVDRLFESQALVRAGRYEDALERLRSVEREAPQLAAVYELQGGTYYLMGRYREALDAYNLARKLNPENAQVSKMRDVLEAGISSRREPAGLSPQQDYGR